MVFETCNAVDEYVINKPEVLIFQAEIFLSPAKDRNGRINSPVFKSALDLWNLRGRRAKERFSPGGGGGRFA